MGESKGNKRDRSYNSIDFSHSYCLIITKIRNCAERSLRKRSIWNRDKKNAVRRLWTRGEWEKEISELTCNDTSSRCLRTFSFVDSCNAIVIPASRYSSAGLSAQKLQGGRGRWRTTVVTSGKMLLTNGTENTDTSCKRYYLNCVPIGLPCHHFAPKSSLTNQLIRPCRQISRAFALSIISSSLVHFLARNILR